MSKPPPLFTRRQPDGSYRVAVSDGVAHHLVGVVRCDWTVGPRAGRVRRWMVESAPGVAVESGPYPTLGAARRRLVEARDSAPSASGHGFPGRFIVVEGGDGAGKTTLAEGLRAELLARGVAVTTTEEPSAGPVGALVRQLLATGPLPAEAMALLFAADRAHHVEAVIRPALARGEVVVCSRYVLSSLAYQGPQVGFARVLELNAHAPAPDLLLFLECTPEDGLGRVLAARAPDAFEVPAVACRASDGYARGLALLTGQGQRVARVDASQKAGAVLRAALAHVLPLLQCSEEEKR